jgi:ribonuclease-3
LSRSAALEARLGHRFGNSALLELALTHRSHGTQNNERLEFLGDGVLGCAVADELFARYPQLSEGQLTRLRASLVRKEALAEVAAELRLAECLRMGGAAGVALTPSVLADAVEALFGAIFIDAGYPAAKASVARAFGFLLERLDPQRVPKDAKTRLQEMLQAKREPLPEYRVVATRGEAHSRLFEVECEVKGRRAHGSGTSLQRAEQAAAEALLEQLDR